MPCEHSYHPDGVRCWQPDRYPLPGGGAYRVLYARIYRCARCLDVQAEVMDHRTNSYQTPDFDAHPPSSRERVAIEEASNG